MKFSDKMFRLEGQKMPDFRQKIAFFRIAKGGRKRMATTLDWERVRMRLERLNTFEGGARTFFSGLHLSEAFKGPREHLCCIDERMAVEKNVVGKQFEAGCGILYPVINVFERARVVAAYLKDKGVTILCPHSDCSAAKAAFEDDCNTGQIVDPNEFSDPDSYGLWFAEMVQGHLNKMTGFNFRPNFMVTEHHGIHYATGVWFDHTGIFNPQVLGKEVPPMFAIDASCREGLGAEYSLHQLRVAYRIALLGEYGFGRKFFRSEEHRFVIAVVATSEVRFQEECEKIAAYVGRHDQHILNHLNISGLVREHHRRHHQHEESGLELR